VTRLLACVEVGGSNSQTVIFGAEEVVVMDGAHQPAGAELAIAVPGIIDGSRVVAASNLKWFDVDPVSQLGLRGPALLVRNDAEAAAIGEAALHGAGPNDVLAFVGLGTGVGGAVVRGDEMIADNLFGHWAPDDLGLGEAACRCGRVGCVETVAAGWALPERVDDDSLRVAAAAVAAAVAAEPAARDATMVVVAGGIARRYPRLVSLIGESLASRRIVATAAPQWAKSAAPWGLRRLVARYTESGVTEGGTS
jgi:predicted NBD/HSP70 family sugar kinase